VKKVHYSRLFLCRHTQRIHSTLITTAAVGRPRSPDCAVRSNASVNKRLLLHQRARETRAACWLSMIHRCDVTDGYLSVQSHTSDERWAAVDAPGRERVAGRGSDGRVHGHHTSDRHHSNWRQQAAAWATAAGCGDWHATAHLHQHWHWPWLTQSGEMVRYRAQFTWAAISLSLGEGEMRGWRLNEVNNMLENLFWGIKWREARLAR